MQVYLDLLRKIMDEGVTVQTGARLPSEGDRQPTARRLHAEQIRFDLRDGFPSVTTKPLWWRAVVAEWIWFMRGSGDGQYLVDQKVDSIWRAWFRPGSTDLGPVYGRQMRRQQGVSWQDRGESHPAWMTDPDKVRDALGLLRSRGNWLYSSGRLNEYALDGWRYVVSRGERTVVDCTGPHHDVVEVDQIANAVADIRAVIANPFDRARRRIIVSLWNPAQIPAMALPPCHTFHAYDLEPPDGESRFIFIDPSRSASEMARIIEGIKARGARWTLNLHLFARSIDAVKGLPFNIASYALMLSVMAAVTGTNAGTLTITFNDVHIYDNQFADVEEQLARSPYPPPRLVLPDGFTTICPDLSLTDAGRLEPALFRLDGYRSHPRLRSESEVAV